MVMRRECGGIEAAVTLTLEAWDGAEISVERDGLKISIPSSVARYLLDKLLQEGDRLPLADDVKGGY